MVVLLAAGCRGADGSAGTKNANLADGEYTVEVTLEGGSGKAGIDSPARLSVEDGDVTAEITWSSPNYDYMLVEGEKYLPVNEEGNSVFQIPVRAFDRNIEVTADTTAMSKPHEIDYILYFDSASIKEKSSGEEGDLQASDSDASASDEGTRDADITEPPEIEGLTYRETVPLDYANCFQIYRYDGGYSAICVDDGNRYLVIPEGCEVPEGAADEYQLLRKPLDHIYLAASAAMSLFDSVDGMDAIRFSALDADSWYVDGARTAMEKGDILFAGKYSEPDYELLLSGKCDLAIESTMILHSPEVREKLEALGIPVLIDRSSYESHPLGRCEWMKVYGELTDRADEAGSCFEGQKAYVEELADFENTGKTVAFFYINESGMIVTRKSSDYFPKMIEEAGGMYIFDGLGDETDASSSVTMTMEEFYASAISADYLIYNATIENPVNSVDDLLEKSKLFADFKAVKNGNVWCSGKYLYQATDVVGSMIQDIHTMLTDESARELSFMVRLR